MLGWFVEDGNAEISISGVATVSIHKGDDVLLEDLGLRVVPSFGEVEITIYRV